MTHPNPGSSEGAADQEPGSPGPAPRWCSPHCRALIWGWITAKGTTSPFRSPAFSSLTALLSRSCSQRIPTSGSSELSSDSPCNALHILGTQNFCAGDCSPGTSQVRASTRTQVPSRSLVLLPPNTLRDLLTSEGKTSF